MISVLNFKKFEKGALRGFFDLRYHGLSIKSCRLMDGNNGPWFAFPQIKGEADGEVKYFDQLFLTPLERDHVTTLILMDLERQGHLPKTKAAYGDNRAKSKPNHTRPPAEDLSPYMPGSGGADQSDIPF